jgi:hypothetical protein
MGLYSVSPSPLLDTGIEVRYHNGTTSLGLTTQLYTAAGSQGISHYYNFYGLEDSNPATDTFLL